MRYIITLLVIVHCIVFNNAQSAEGKAKAQEYITECKQKFNANLEMVRNRQELPGNQKCFYKCMAQKLGLMDSKGRVLKKFAQEKIAQRALTPIMQSAMDRCLEIKKVNACEKAEAIIFCMRDAAVPGMSAISEGAALGQGLAKAASLPNLPSIPGIPMLKNNFRLL